MSCYYTSQECSICMETCKSPKLIPCHHSFCYTCLEDYVRANLENGQFNCPLCRESVELPKEGVSGFQTNVYIDTDSFEKITCDLCGTNSVASSRCLDCEENLCRACCHAHEKSKVSKHHKISDLGTLDPEMKGKIRMRTFCDQHPEEELKLVCQNCNVLICVLCKAVNHENHVTKTVADAATEVKTKLHAKMNSCTDKLRLLNAAEQKAGELDRKINDAELEEIEALEHQHSQLLKILDQEVAKFKYKITHVYGELRKENAVFKADVQEQTKTCSNANENIQKLIDEGTHIKISKQGPDLERSTSKAISKTDPTPTPSLENTMFVAAEIQPSVLISLLGIMQDTTTMSPTQQLGQMFQAGGTAGYFVPTMPQATQRDYFAPQTIPQKTADPQRPKVCPGQPASQTGGFQNMPTGPQVRPTRRAATAQPNMRPIAPVRAITGQNTTQPRATLPVTQSNVQGRPTAANVPPQQARPYKLPQMRNVPQAQQQQPTPPQAVVILGQEPLTFHMLASAPPQEQKQMLGERLFPLIQSMYPDLAGKITGMLLEIDNTELMHMLESLESLKAKVDEAVAVLQAHQAKEAATQKKASKGRPKPQQ